MSNHVQLNDEIVPLSGYDTSLLAVIAENPSMPAAELDRLLRQARPEIETIARAIVALDAGVLRDSDSDQSVLNVARAFLQWARENRKIKAIG